MPSFEQAKTSPWPEDVGILAIEVYFPMLYVEQMELEEYDQVSKGKYTIGLGQSKMGFCTDREDINSLCLTVLQQLVQKNGILYEDIGFLGVGTETIIDKSKSVKSVLMQLFEGSGNSDVEGIDTTNACYGGTAALLNAVSWIESSSWDGRLAVVVAGDIAVYAKGNARPTGGAGAIAMLIGPNAPLVLDRGVRATHMSHVYDFYKPDLLSEYPRVDGKLSVECYSRALDICYAGYCKKFEKLLAKDGIHKRITLNDLDAVLFHAPYCKLVQKSFARLALNDFLKDPNPDLSQKYAGLERFRDLKLENTVFNREVEKAFMEWSQNLYDEKTKPSLLLANQVGNMYTPSLYGCLVSYLCSKNISELAGKRIALFSYGSGLASTMFSMRISTNTWPDSPLDKLHRNLNNVQSRLQSRKKVAPEEFSAILQLREETHHKAPYTPVGCISDLFPGTWYLSSVDDMHRRKYEQVPSEISNGWCSPDAKENCGITAATTNNDNNHNPCNVPVDVKIL